MRLLARLGRLMPDALPRSAATDAKPAGGRWRKISALAILGAVATARDAAAIEIVKIEEFWELRIGEPDSLSSSPQVAMVTSPTGDLGSDYFIVTLNHRSYPDFTAGGVQVQRWHDDEVRQARATDNLGPLEQMEDKISWTQRLTLDDGEIAFEVVDGHSQSWGDFGGDGDLRVTLESSALNLNAYRPAVSIAQSGVSFAGNRVRSLTLMRLRWTDTTGQVYELEAPIDIDADLDP